MKISFLAVATICCALSARAAPPSPSPSVAAITGDKTRGEMIATKGAGSAPACASCHGPQGHGVADFPHLAGQGQQYLLEQLRHFADGSRNNAVMAPVAKALSEADAQAVTAYFASLPAVTITAKPVAAPTLRSTQRAEWLMQRGDAARGLPACSSCHGSQGRGVGTQFPMIAGLSANYITEQLKAWQSRQRPDGPLALMGDIARKLSAEDTQALAQHLAGLTATTPAPAQSTASGAGK